ncbi:protein-methionine-sulfoxide reductase catalytic subunit MsrP [Aestuariibius sp. 2305UL40-4]|uniref:protein-methionine-sulfoxide reductase catalytic subunit MsrP n=1 Tax=Aestuariibius violaceus TaxID=3234132 RepID=UPI00345F1445
MTRRRIDRLTQDDVTPKELWLKRRQILAGLAGLGAIAPMGARASDEPLEPNTFEEITTYNNFYEFGTGKSDPSKNAHKLQTEPWSITIDGAVEEPVTLDFAALSEIPTEERIYRFRCVEAWSMVIPWNGFELSQLLDRVTPLPSAQYVQFETAVQPDNMIGVRRKVLNFPYREGLRLDEARHPLTIMATGLYGEPMPNQNGAPIRLVVPWKYGFKSIKSIVRITFTEEEPFTTWNDLNPSEYGFYSNVNPNVDHPRWSQATERRIGGGLFNSRQDTLMFNGYEDEVADLYEGMDLTVQI